MATLAGSTIASTYTYLLKMSGTSGLTSSLVAVQDGDATDSVLYLATDSALISGNATKLYFFDADGDEHISADNAGNLTLAAGVDLNLTATTDVNIPVNVGLRFGDGGENIETDNTNLTITSGGNIVLAVGNGTAGVSLLFDNEVADISDNNVFGVLDFYDNDGGGTAAGITAKIEAKAASTYGASEINFHTSGSSGGNRQSLTSQMRISPNGDVTIGMGDEPAEEPLHIGTETTNVGQIIQASYDNNANPRLVLRKSDGSIASKDAITSGHLAGQIKFDAYDGDSWHGSADIFCVTSGTVEDAHVAGNLVFRTAPDSASGVAERLRITSAGLISNGNSVPATQAMSILTSGNAVTTAEFQSTATSQSGTTAGIVYTKSDTSATANYNFMFCRASGSDEGKWDGTGRLHGQGGAVTSMDYAEYFESTDGSAIPVGTTVVLDGGKVKPSSSGETPIGVVRPYGTSSIVGGTAWNHWNKRWVTTDYDEVVFEDYETYEWYDRVKDETTTTVFDEDEEKYKEVFDYKEVFKTYETDKVPEGVTVPDDAKTVSVDLHGNKLRRRKVNPDYDPDRAYEERKDRDEWNIIGLLGQVAITKGQPTASNWVKMKDISDTVEMWFVK